MNDKSLSQSRQEAGPLTFGFDIGIASVGWAILGRGRIVDLGVRCFDAAETPDKGKPLNERRRLMRTARNRLARRALRLKKLRRLLRDAELVTSADVSSFESTGRERGSPSGMTPWLLRAKGLDHRLEPDEWARVLYHLVKHRGFFAARKSEAMDDTKEGGKLSKGVARTARLLDSDGARRWRTLGEMVACDKSFALQKRNKAGSYENSLARSLLGDELRLLFEQQRTLGNPHAGVELEAQVWQLFSWQKPALTGQAMLEMVGRCTFEPTEYRAPKRSYTAERFVWLSKLNNVRVVEAGERRPLSGQERQSAVDLPFRSTTGKVTYKQLRRAIALGDGTQSGFAGLSYGSKRNKKGELVDPEEATLVELKGWAAMRKALEGSELTGTWQRLSSAALQGDPSLLDAIALALSIYKSDSELRPELARLALDGTEVEALLSVDYTNFIQLSTKAIRRLMPHLQRGLRYDEACTEAGYNHAAPTGEHMRRDTLPPLAPKALRNPVVYRSLNQARKVLNALVREYGAPVAVHVELARDLSKSFDDRQDIRRGQEDYRDEKERAYRYFIDQIGRPPKRDDLLKMRLYREQDGQCAYSQQPLAPDGDVRRVFEIGITEVDHVLPYSRSFDDSQNNKVLVLTKENRDKGNRTPYEYLDGAAEGERWRLFNAWVRGHKSLRKAKRDRLLRKHFEGEDAEGFRERNLNDTRYITRFFADYVRRNLKFAKDGDGVARKQPVLCPAGGFTGFLRARWGLVKDRGASDLHHALDACVIAAASQALQKRVSDFSRRNELVQMRDGTFVDRQTGEILSSEAAEALGEHFPRPWPLFDREVAARLSAMPRPAIEGHLPNYDAAALDALRPVLVSRAVKRRAAGPVHQDTVRSIKPHLGANTSSKRTPLESLKVADLDKIVGASDPRNAGLVAAIKARLEAHGGNGKKAFGPGTEPLHKPLRDGTPGPIVRAVRVESVQKGGVPVRGGVADQASMWRVDVFSKGGKFFLVPIYQSDRRKGAALPNMACVAHKPRSGWTAMDEGYAFSFSLFPNDLVRLTQRGITYFGYFAGTDIGSANVSILSHDRSVSVGKDGLWRGLGVKLGVERFEKLHVDVLGRYHIAKKEVRLGLA